MRTLTILLTSILTLSGAVEAACRVQTVRSFLPDYHALLSVSGALEITVGCETPRDQFRLFLEDAGPEAHNSQSMTIFFTQGTDILRTSLSGNPKQLRGFPLRGSQTLTFPLDIAPDQWSRVGAYQAQLRLALQNTP